MGIYIFKNGAAVPLGGGVNRKATDKEYGLARISESSAVTETGTGLVLSAKEKNSGIEGTLANGIENINGKIDGLEIEFDGNGYENLNKAVEACVDSLPLSLNKTYFATIAKGARFRALIQTYWVGEYASAVVFGYGLDSILLFTKVNGVWHEKSIS